MLDTADGRLARLQGTSSAFGRWLDQVLDELADMVLHAAIAWAAFCRDGWPGWLLLGMLYASSKYLFQVQSLLGEELEGEMKRARVATVFVPRGTPHPGPLPASGAREACGASRGRCAVDRPCGSAVASLDWTGALGRLDLALVAYAFYFALRAIGGGVRKAVRYA